MAITTNPSERTIPTANAQQADQVFEALFHRHWTRVYAVLYRLVGDPAEADELSLEVFWRLYREPPERLAQPELLGWLYRVATRLGLNALRARKRRNRYEGRAVPVDSSMNPEAESELAETREQVRQVLSEMRARQAQILILRHSGLSYAEVAEAVGVSPGSVGTLLARAEREFARRYRKLEGG